MLAQLDDPVDKLTTRQFQGVGEEQLNTLIPILEKTINLD